MLRKVLIANRGEIAVRVIRACRALGLETVAVHSTADAEAMHARLADASICIGPPQAKDSYLNSMAILAAAEISGADAIHPGYGFLSENADFAQMVEDHGLAFIGPSPEHIRLMGDKITAKRAAAEAGLPVVPGTEEAIEDAQQAKAVARDIGYPLLIKAAAGGGGRGMVVAHDEDGLLEGLRAARREAEAGFGDPRVYIEKFLANPRHIEIQIIADQFGHVLHLGERDCSLQRRHQKLVEEAPATVLDPQTRHDFGARVADAVAQLGYRGAGTVEFLYHEGAFYFIEMNTRLQVEHPVTEMVTGIDLVSAQIEIASGQALRLRQDQVRFTGHAIECRINAEDPETMLPAAGRVEAYHAPGGPGVRVDSALYAGYAVPPYYDSLVAKLIVHAGDRASALARLKGALAEYVITGLKTNIPLFLRLLDDPDIVSGRYDTGWLARRINS